MQFDADLPFAHAITDYNASGIAVQGRWHTHSMLVGSDGLLREWPLQHPGGPLAEADLAAVLEQAVHQPEQPYELLIVGTGQRQIFLPPTLLRLFVQHRLPLECMSTPAACRTYNIVASEGRRVLAALQISA